MKSIISISNIIRLNAKYLLFNWKRIWIFIFIFICSLLIPLIFVPLLYCIGLVLFLGIILPSAVIYISTTYNLRSGTLKINLETSSSKFYMYIGSYITMNIYVFLSLIPMLISLYSLQELNLLMLGWLGSEMSEAYKVLQINYFILLYGMFEITLVTFSVLFISQNLIKSEKGMYSLVAMIVIFAIIFGGVFNNSFAPTPAPINGDYFNRVPQYRANPFGEKLYYPIAIIFPFFGPMQHLATLKFSISSKYNYSVHFFVWHHSLFGTWQAMHWDILWLLPYIHTFIFAATSIFITHYRE